MPNIASVTRIATMFAPRKVPLRKSERSSSGSRWCISSSTNAAKDTAATTKSPMMRADVQPY